MNFLISSQFFFCQRDFSDRRNKQKSYQPEERKTTFIIQTPLSYFFFFNYLSLCLCKTCEWLSPCLCASVCVWRDTNTPYSLTVYADERIFCLKKGRNNFSWKCKNLVNYEFFSLYYERCDFGFLFSFGRRKRQRYKNRQERYLKNR